MGISYPVAFACKHVSSIKCFLRDSTLNIQCGNYLIAAKVYCSS